MADKEIRVKIVADTSDISKKINALERSLKDMASTIDKADNNSFDNLIEDVDRLEKSINEAESEIKELDDSLERIDNNSLNKLQKSTEETRESFNNLEKSLKEVSDAIEKTDNNNFNNLIEDTDRLELSLREAEDKIKELSDALEKMDSNDLSKLQRNTEETRESFDELEKMLKEVSDAIERTDNSNFNKLTNDIDKLKISITDVVDRIKELGLVLGRIDGNDLSKLQKNINETKEDFKELSDRVLPDMNKRLENIQDSGKENNNVFDRFKDTFSGLGDSANNFGVKISGSFSKGSSAILDTVSAVSNFNTATTIGKSRLDSLSKAISHNVNWLKDQEKELNEVAEAIKKQEKQIKLHEDIQKDLSNSSDIERTAKNIEVMKNKLKDLCDIEDKLKGDMQKVKNVVEEQVEEFRDLGGAIKDLGVDVEQSGSSFDGLKEKIKGAFDSLLDGDFGGAISNLKDSLSDLFKALPAEVKMVIAAVTLLTTALKKCADAGVNQLKKGLSTLSNGFSKISSVAKSFGNEIKNAFENITGSQLDLSSIMEQVVEFESIMYQVGAITGTQIKVEGTGELTKEFQTLVDIAREWGATTRYSATEVGEAMTYMGMAGWSAQEIMDGLGGVLNLATVGCLDLGQASDFVTDGLSALGMQAVQSNDFVDMLAATIVNSNTGVAQMQEAFTNVAPIAGTLGISMSDLSVGLGLMADQGVKGAKAGTALKNLMTNLSSPTEKMSKCIAEYNLEAAQTKIVNGDLIGGIQEMQTQLSGLTAAQKVAVISTIAGKEALSGVSALLKSDASRINELKFAVDSSTKSSRMFAESLGLINKNGDTLAKEGNERVVASFEKMVETQGDAYKKWQEFNSVLGETTDTMTLVGGSTTDLGAIIQKLGEDGKVTTEEVNNILDAFDKLTDGSDKATAALKEYGIELVRNDDNSLNFSETLKSVGEKWDTLSESQKKSLASQLGISASVEDLNELFSNNGEKIEELIDAYEKAQGVSEHMAKTFDSSLKGSILNLSSAIEERFLQVFDKIKPAVQGAIDAMTKFFNVWNGMEEGLGKGFASAITWLEGESRKWGEAIANGLSSAINNLDKFINSQSFDSLLQIGTNIINGIAKGITTAKDNGSLDRAISGAIRKIGTWCSENLDTLIEVGGDIIESISNGITENQDLIGEVLQKIIELQTNFDTAVAYEKGRLYGEMLGTYIGEGLMAKLEIARAEAEGFMAGIGEGDDWVQDENGEWKYLPKRKDAVEQGRKNGQAYGEGQNKGFEESKSLSETVNEKLAETKVGTDQTAAEIGQGISDNIVAKLETLDAEGLKALQAELEALQTTTETVAAGIGTAFTSIQDSARTSFTGLTNIVRNQLLNCTNIIRNQMVNCTNIVRNQALNMSNIFRNQFVNMSNIARNQFVNVANIIRNQMVNSANIVRNQCVNMANIFRNQFVSMANVARNQMVNVSNIVRNQAISWSNVIRNQVTNARNAFTQQMISMASVARTQMVNVSNIIRNQATQWSSTIRSQSASMKSSFTSAFSGLSSIAASQMAKCLSVVKSYMSQIRAATAQKMTMSFSVNRTITTTNVTRTIAKGMAATVSSMNASMFNVSKANTANVASVASVGVSDGSLYGNNGFGNGSLALEVPLYLDGREIARATASYNQAELAKLDKRAKRKRGE